MTSDLVTLQVLNCETDSDKSFLSNIILLLFHGIGAKKKK